MVVQSHQIKKMFCFVVRIANSEFWYKNSGNCTLKKSILSSQLPCVIKLSLLLHCVSEKIHVTVFSTITWTLMMYSLTTA